MRKILVLLPIISCVITSYSQKISLREKLYKLEGGIINGDIDALNEIATYIDDTTFVQEFLGYHNYPNSARGVTIRIIEENCLFTDEEFKTDSTISTSKFLNLLNTGKVVFDDLTGMFLITDLTKRKTEYELKKITDYSLKRIDTTVGNPSYAAWYYENQIDGFLVTKNSEVLKWVASAWFHKRSRFNRYYFNDEEFTDLIKKITRLELGVPDEKGEITFLYKNDYYAKARLNYLIYWTNHYSDYKWNDEKEFFENINEAGSEKTREDFLFGLLNSQDDSIAIDAYIQITELDTGKVTTLAEEYEKNDIDNNYNLPTFLYRFIKQASLFTQYCRDNQINYRSTGGLKDSLSKLKEELSYASRYQLENYLIENLDLENVTAVEYFGLIYEQEWEVTFSLGRILDKFYTRKFKNLYSNKKYLASYFKKARLFDDIGIIGICNKYLRKFENCSEEAINSVKGLLNESTDSDIKQEAEKTLAIYKTTPAFKVKERKSWAGNNEQIGVSNLKQKYLKIKASKKKDDEKENDIQELFGKISYSQIGEAIKILQKDTSLGEYDKFHFLESDFGFSINIYDPLSIEGFLARYSIKSEYNLYEFYLKESGLNCLDINWNFNFNNMYNVLKYDIVDAFVGGGGGRRGDGVYLVIKLLELKYKTTLGFPAKQCSWQGIYSCDTDLMERAKAWMSFFEEKNLINPNKNDPPSISYNN
jgi:hypothetical protein